MDSRFRLVIFLYLLSTFLASVTAVTGIILFNDCGEREYKPAPVFDAQMNDVHTGKYRPIRVCKNIDNRFILEDLFAKIRRMDRE